MPKAKGIMYRVIRSISVVCGIAVNSHFPLQAAGTNPFDCKNPACSSKMDMLQQAMGKGKKRAVKHMKKECPLDREELGNATWKLLHTIAANYPDNPTPTDISNITVFITSLSQLYPCPYCAEDFRVAIETNPIDASSHAALSMWLCERHNEVNSKLNKPQLPCDISSLDSRWRNGGEECSYQWQHANETEENEEKTETATIETSSLS